MVEGLFAEQSLPLRWAFDDYNKMIDVWAAYAADNPLETYVDSISENSYYIKSRLNKEIPGDIRKHVHTITNAIKHSLDQVTNAFSDRVEPNKKHKLHFPWAESPHDLNSILNKFHPKPQDTFQMYESFGCFYADVGGDKYFRNLAKATNPGKHEIPIAVRPIGQMTKATSQVEAGIPLDGSIVFHDNILTATDEKYSIIAKVTGYIGKVDISIEPTLLFGNSKYVKGESVIELLGYSLYRAKDIIDDMEAWLIRNSYASNQEN